MQQQQSSEASFKGESRAAPVNYIIDRGGKIAAAWLGYDQNSTQGIDVLTKLELE